MIDLGLGGKRARRVRCRLLPTRAGHGRDTTLQLARGGARSPASISILAGPPASSRRPRRRELRHHAIVADMTDRAQVGRAIAEAVQALGGIDVCVDIIGGARWNKVEEITADEWEWTIENNLTEYSCCSRRSASR